MSYVRGLAAYPDQVCFDPQRPSWLPYWFDTPGEGACWWDTTLLGDVPGKTIAHDPAKPAQIILTPDATAENTLQLQCESGGGTWDPASNVCKPGGVGWTPWIVLGGILVGIGIFSSR